jgi:hypothetical protein
MKIAAIFMSFVFVAPAFSRSLESISSCDGRSVITYEGDYTVALRNGSQVSKIKLEHELNGGAIDPVRSMFVVYGVPKKTNRDNPQVMTVSVYKNLKRPSLVQRESLGGGVHSALFSKDHRFIVVDTRFGDLVIDTKNNKTKMLPLIKESEIDVVDCRR